MCDSPTHVETIIFALPDIDLSYNALPRLPESLYKIRTLKRLNVCNNEIVELTSCVGKLSMQCLQVGLKLFALQS